MIQHQINWLLQEKYQGKLTPSAKKDIQRLKAGTPVDYLIGFMEFLGCRIDLSKKPLIPRVETEFWTEKAIDELKVHRKSLKVLDMFAGSGCIGIAILTHIPNSDVVFADSEKNTIQQIAINAKLNKVNKKRYQIIQSDIFKNIQGKFDYIFANPPYIPTTRKHRIQTSVIGYEPAPALFGGSDGLMYIRRFLLEAMHFLGLQGKIYMEFDSLQKRKIESLIKRSSYSRYQFHKDQYAKWRYVVVEK